MEITLDRIGKLALFAAMTSREEEDVLKEEFLSKYKHTRLAVTFVTGTKSEIMRIIPKSAISCAIQNNVIKKVSTQIHAIIHATLEAIGGIVDHIPSDTSLKLKLSIVTDHEWVAVAIYGDSAVHPVTNHERAGLGIMHL
jgi:hut operon positive regulator